MIGKKYVVVVFNNKVLARINYTQNKTIKYGLLTLPKPKLHTHIQQETITMLFPEYPVMYMKEQIVNKIFHNIVW